LGGAMSSPPQYYTHGTRVRARESSGCRLGIFHWCSYCLAFSKKNMNRIHPLGQLCNSQKITHRYYSTSYHRESSSEPTFCVSWILWFLSIFTDKHISQGTGKWGDSLGIVFSLLFRYFCRQ
jgi:hypothetical protein